MRCPTCGVENRENARFCQSCGASLEEPLPNLMAAPDRLAGGERDTPPLLEEVTMEPQDMLEGEAETAPPEEAHKAREGTATGLPEGSDQPLLTVESAEEEGAEEPAAHEQEADVVDVETEADAGEPVVLAPGPDDAADWEAETAPIPIAEIAPTPEESPAQEPAASIPFVPASPGTVLADRYLVIRVLEDKEDRILYHSLDLIRCQRCGFEGNNLDDAFCAQCGAAMDEKPPVAILQLRDSEAALSVQDATVDSFSSETGHFLVLADLEVQTPESARAGDTRILVGQSTDEGKVRDLNEDSLLTLTLSAAFESRTEPVMGLLAVADGMGGHEGGEIASRLALQVLAREVIQNLILPLGLLRDQVPAHRSASAQQNASEHRNTSAHPDASTPAKGFAEGDSSEGEESDLEPGKALEWQAEGMATSLEAALATANDAVYLARQKRGNDMGTTLTAALICSDRLVLAHVGDSRAYRWSDGGLQPLTKDHSLVARMIEAGDAEPEEIYTHPHRNVIYRSIGDTPVVEVDATVLPLSPGDRLVLCSDGLWEMIRDEGIEDVMMMEADPQAACELLVSRANLAGGDDNISVIVAQMEIV